MKKQLASVSRTYVRTTPNALFIILLLGFNAVMTAQTFVNKSWVKTTGLPDDINWTATAFDSDKNLIFVGNTVTAPGNANLLITKYLPDGSIAWQRVSGGSAGLNDYGVAITIDNQNNSYVAAAMTAANGLFDFAVLKYDADGILQWTATWDGSNHLHDIPTAITLDDAENIIVTGGTTSFTQQLNYAVVKFNSAGTRLWATTYDHANLYDFPTAIQKATNDNIVVTGASANAANSWDYATILVNGATGQIQNVNRVNVPEIGLDQPLAVVRDNQNNLFITGYNEKLGNKNIQTVKLNSNFGLEWVKSYDAEGLEDMAKSIGCDAFGNVYVAGHSKTAQEGNRFTVLKYDSQGNLLWNQTYKPYTHDGAQGADIKVMPTGDFYLSGTIQKGSEKDFATLKYNKDGEIEWEKRFEDVGSDEVTTIKADNDGNVYVSGISESNHLKTYTTVKYQSIEVPHYIVRDVGGAPEFSANRIIVKFNPQFVKREAIDESSLEKETNIATPEHFLTSAAAQLLRNTISTDGEIYLERIFHHLKTTDTLTRTRMNEPLIIPPFWSAFAVVTTDSIPTMELIDSLNSKKQMIEYAHPNFFIQLQSGPNDISYSGNQASLHPTSDYPCTVSGDCPNINVEPAWNYEKGKSFVKVGIYDNGIDAHLNPDFQWDDCTNVVKGGHDYFRRTSGVSPDWNDGHGTSIAGIIGAIRNNEKGIAGIAGGDHLVRPCPLPAGTPGDRDRQGVSLYAMTIYPPAPLIPSVNSPTTFQHVCDAIIEGSIHDRFGLHIMNNSWRITYGSSEQNRKIALLSESVHFANRAKVIYVAARGNQGTTEASFPASFDDDNLRAPDNIFSKWARHSSSNTLPPLGANGSLLPHEKVKIEGINNNTCTLSGFVYQLFDASGQSKGWMPADISAGDLSNIHFHYSILAAGIETSVTTGNTESVGKDWKIYSFPNPTTSTNTIEIYGEGQTTIKVELYDVLGRKVKNVFQGTKDSQTLQIECDMTDMASGLYIYDITIGNITKRILKISKF
jgi:hypothetical protein